MQSVRSKDTIPELTLRRALWIAGVRGWRVHRKNLPGRPDIAISRASLAIFVDGGFWHGRPDRYWPGRSGAYWDAKIARNRARDHRVDLELAAAGWKVLRFWDSDVMADPLKVASTIRGYLTT
jgi:DNA mismatch endonuclease (patch repair protein)